MRTVIVSEFVTVDGVVEAPGGEPTHPHTGWTVPYHSDDLVGYKLAETLDAGSLLLGRTTYESFVEAWPQRDGEFADRMNAMPKHVVTSRPGLTWNATALSGEVPAAVRDLTATDGGPVLVVGSATLVHLLLAEGLVDELRMIVFPVAVGGGLRLFPHDRRRLAWRLDELRRFDGGAVLQVLRPAG